MYDVSDLRTTIVPKSDQLNSEQLLSGPITIHVTDVRIGSSDEQPIKVHYEGENGRPFLPCKTMRKVLIFAWGADGREWVGRSMSLYCDPQVRFGGAEVGGIRISHMTDIDRDIQVSLTATKGKKALHTIKRLEVDRGPALEDVLQAIRSASNKATMAAAKAMALRLASQADVDAASAAYTARTAELKGKAAAPATTKTLAQYSDDVSNATCIEAAQLVVDEASAVLSEADLTSLKTVFTASWEF
jgi:hypothetical protein